MTHKAFVLILAALSICFLLWAIDIKDVDGIIIANAISRMALVMTVAVSFSAFWINRNYDVDKTIFQNPVAIALYMAGVWIALAIAAAGSSG